MRDVYVPVYVCVYVFFNCVQVADMYCMCLFLAVCMCVLWSVCVFIVTVVVKAVAAQTLRWAGWDLHSPPVGWTCGSASCSCLGWTAACPRSPHCSLMMGDAAASGPQQSTGSPSSFATSSSSPIAPWGRNLKRSFFNVLRWRGARLIPPLHSLSFFIFNYLSFWRRKSIWRVHSCNTVIALEYNNP